MSKVEEQHSYQMPDARGHFGPYGGQFVPETLMHPLEELIAAYDEARDDPQFQEEFAYLLKHYVGRPTPLMLAGRLTEHLGGARIYLKREDLCHTGAHKINNSIGQVLLARRMGKRRIIAETGAGQHGVATATVCALMGLDCVVYMGTEDMRRQELNVFRMRLLGAEMVGVEAGGHSLKLGEHAARFSGGRPGVLQGTRSYILQDDGGQVALTHSVSAGLDYSAIGPEHAYLHDLGRIDYTSANDTEALEAFELLAKLEGIIPALESSHAIAEVIKTAPRLPREAIIIVNLSGRGDKDVNTVAELILKQQGQR